MLRYAQIHPNAVNVLQDGGKYVLNNHLRFNILFHRDTETDLARIVGFEVRTWPWLYTAPHCGRDI